jgi:Ca2+-binding EF-hand superfamily protein
MTYQLTPDNAKYLTQLFKIIDSDNSGSLDIYEIIAFFKHITGGKIDLKPQAFEADFKFVGKKLSDKLTPNQSVNILIDAACLGTILLAAALAS